MKPAADPTSDAKTFMKGIALFGNLSEPALLALARAGKFIQFRKGQAVFYQSDPSEKVYLLRSGLVSIVLESPDGREMVINEMHAGDIFG